MAASIMVITVTATADSTTPLPTGRTLHPAALLIIVILGIVAYANSMRGAFILDDFPHIVANADLRAGGDLRELLRDHRPLVALTLAFNMIFDDAPVGQAPNPLGFHLFNLLIHLINGILVYAVILRAAQLRKCCASTGAGLAFAVAALWIVHPLTTQAVTYIIQRSEAMMAMFYLGTLYAILRLPVHRLRWTIVAVILAALGMLTKAVMVTVPVAALLADRGFVSSSWSQLIRRHWPLHLGLMLTWSLMFVTGIATGVLSTAPNASANVGFSIEGITPMQYLFTQGGVLLEYLRLTVWPASLHVMYDVPTASTIGDALPAGLVIIVLLILTVVLLRKAPSFGVPAALFFVILAPTSSIVPIRDLYFEHRMYLPLAMALVVIVGFMMKMMSLAAAREILPLSRGRKVFIGVVPIAVIALTARTMQRNGDYNEPSRLWLQTTAAQPENFNAWSLLGQRYMETGRYDLAIPALESARDAALARGDIAADDRQFINVILSLGIARGATGDIESSIREYTRVLERDPGNVRAMYNRSVMNMRMQRYAEALQDASRTVDLAPDFAAAHLQVGDLLVLARDEQQALRAYARVTELDPYHEPARTRFAALLINAGFLEQAEEQLNQSLAINPRSTIALYNIGRIRERQKRNAEAIRLYRAALAVEPDFAPARTRLEALAGTMRNTAP